MSLDPYSRRTVDDELDALIEALPAIALEGAKGVGKTATAVERARTIRSLDDAAQLEVARADPQAALTGTPPVLLDEWQHLPQLWNDVRRAVDSGSRPGSFLMTGSASPEELGTHSGAGRIVSLRMRPMGLHERGLESPSVSLGELLAGGRPRLAGRTEVHLATYVDEILRSGFPGLRSLTGRALRAQLDGYIDRVIDRDFVDLGHRVRNPARLRRWMAAYGAATSTTTSFERIRDAATGDEGDKPAKSTTIPYRDVLERLWILDPVPAWAPTRNTIAKLSSPPKHHLVDPALAARLAGLSADALLGSDDGNPRDGASLGALFESLVTLSVRVAAQQAEARVGHMRTARGEREVDLIVERSDHRVVAVEIKLSATVGDDDVRHLHWLREKLGDDLLDAIVITTGQQAYRRADGIGVVPASLLGA